MGNKTSLGFLESFAINSETLVCFYEPDVAEAYEKNRR